MASLWELHEALEVDPLRERLGWGAGFREAQDALLNSPDDAARSAVLQAWLGEHQPCLFGKLAARAGAIEYCFLPFGAECTDSEILARITSSRVRWRQAGIVGEKHAIVALALSERLALARPNGALREFALRLASLFLLEEQVAPDEIKLDALYLEIPDLGKDHLLKWHAGVNVFAAAGDRRWWQDHRIPGGVAFSVNSVGHMVKSAILRGGMSKLLVDTGLGELGLEAGKLDSLPDALKLAMRTIHKASTTPSGPATWLVPAEEKEPEDPQCPVDLGKQLNEFNPCWYRGMYHTDHTVPTVYFRDDVDRPVEIGAQKLDFTYLFHDSVSNPAHLTMGLGERITGEEAGEEEEPATGKAGKQWPQTCTAEESERVLREAGGS